MYIETVHICLQNHPTGRKGKTGEWRKPLARFAFSAQVAAGNLSRKVSICGNTLLAFSLIFQNQG